MREAIDWMTRAELLRMRSSEDYSGGVYLIHERGRAFVEALCKMPLPEQRWVMPPLPARLT